MAAKKNKQLVRHFYEEAFAKGNFALADEVLASDYMLHDATAPDFGGGIDEWKKFQSKYRKAFPDHRLVIEDQIAEGDKVVTRWTTQGTHKADLPGILAIGKHIKITGITITRISNGKIAEEWQNWDTLGLLQQLGVVYAPPS